MTKPMDYFEAIAAIPHPSGCLEKITAYVVSEAEKNGYEHSVDKAGNIVVRIPATDGYESSAAVMLQGHLDMVPSKTANSDHDFENDPLQLRVIDDMLYATDTTLGGDNGVAVAYMLAIMNDHDLPHPELECVFTSDEEMGLIGANAMDCSGLRAKYLINMDSADEGLFTVSCAGGKRYNLTVPYTREDKRGLMVNVEISGLKGGHSGEDIHRGRCSANIEMRRILKTLNEKYDFCLFSLFGGTADNAIPSSAEARFLLPSDVSTDIIHLVEVENALDQMIHEIKDRFAETDPDMKITIGIQPEDVHPVIPADQTAELIDFLCGIPSGIIARREENPELVCTSANIGIVSTASGLLNVVAHLRSALDADMAMMSKQVEELVEEVGGSFVIHSQYPAWEFQKDSAFRDLAMSLFESMYAKKAEMLHIHAGIECGILKGKMSWLDMISIGPDCIDLHSATEHFNIPSFERVYAFVCEFLKRMDASSGL